MIMKNIIAFFINEYQNSNTNLKIGILLLILIILAGIFAPFLTPYDP